MYSLTGISSSLSQLQVLKEDIRYNSCKRSWSSLSWRVRMVQILHKLRQMYSSELRFLVPLEISRWKKQRNSYSISLFFQVIIRLLLELRECSKQIQSISKEIKRILVVRVVVIVLRMMRMSRQHKSKRQMERKVSKDKRVPSLSRREWEGSKNMMD